MRGIRDRGKTVFLTTHLMEEAERLCDRVAIIEHGRIIDIGTPARARRAATVPSGPSSCRPTIRSAARTFRGRLPAWRRWTRQDTRFTIRGRGDDFVTDVIQCLSEHRIKVTEFRTESPNLEDVFLSLTGHSIRD